jgi:hypothetical protein
MVREWSTVPISLSYTTPRGSTAQAKKFPDAAPVSEAASEAEVQKALVVGNYGAAVDACLAADRFTDALLLASMGGGDLWARAQVRLSRRALQRWTSCEMRDSKVWHGATENGP